MQSSIIYKFLAIFSVTLVFTTALFAQATDNGGLEGTVYDVNAAVVPNATVKAKNTISGETRTATTNEEGRYKFVLLSPGTYEVTTEKQGFETNTQTASVEAASSNVFDIYISVEGIKTDVVVVSTNQNEIISEGSPQSEITGKKLETVPLVNRSSFSRLAIDTSTSGNLTSPLDNGTGNPETSVVGTRTTSSSVVINGIDATPLVGTGSLSENVAPAPEVVQEVKLLSSGYDASLGRSGGGSYQVVFREGSNAEYNGSAYFYFQNEAFNANDFFFNRDGIDRQVARRYEGGATIGGPIIRNKLRFFAGYQRTDAKTAYIPAASSFTILPEALAYITDRANPEAVRLAFLQAAQNGGIGRVFQTPGCIRNLTPTTQAQTVINTCIDPSQVGFRLLSLINPATGDFLIPTLNEGRFERLYLDGRNVALFSGGRRLSQEEIAALGFPNGLPLLDSTFQQEINGGNPLVRFRNVFPGEFEQDQITTRIDWNVAEGNSTDGSGRNDTTFAFFFADFPQLNPFSEDTLVSPFPLIRDDGNRTFSVKNTHIFSPTLFNEARFGIFYLDNSRKLDERFLAPELTNDGQGIINPATAFVQGPETQRLAHIVGTGNLTDFSLNAPNNIYNQRKQVTFTFANNVTKILDGGNHTLRFGVEHKINFFDTTRPNEQGVEFEGLINFTQLLTTQVPEADVSLGVSDKNFRFKDYSLYVTDDWRFSNYLTFNVGVRWDLFGLPVEKNGLFSNFDFDRVTDPNNILPGFILPSNSQATGFAAIDDSAAALPKADTKHTLNGLDYNNFAPRFGFALRPFKNEETVIRGGYGIFYDRPSAAFINTIFTNFPYFTDIEASNVFNPATVQGSTAFGGIDPNIPFINRFPFSLGLVNLADTTPYVLRDNSAGLVGTRGAEPLEYRAIDRDLKTPMVQQWNLGVQHRLFKNWTVEARYVGTRGQNLLLAVGFNQPYDLNDPNTPDYIYARINAALASVFPGRLPDLLPGQTERDRGMTLSGSNPRAFGACNFVFANTPGYAPCVGAGGAGGIDLNLTSFDFENPRAIISAAVRVPFLGFDPTEAIILQSRGYSYYHGGTFNISRSFANNFSFNASYTFSKSIDIGSTDPGSTAASGRPDTANLGLIVQGNQRDLNSNRAVSDFDRPHRFSSSFVFQVPTFGSNSKWLKGFEITGFGQWQSGTPFTIYASDASFGDPVASGAAFLRQYLGIIRLVTERNTPMGGVFREERYNVGAGSGTIFDVAFGRPSVRSLDILRRQGGDITEQYFNTCQDPADSECALISPLGGFGNLGRNTLRGPSQKRFDLSFTKRTALTERMELELKWDIFNVFNLVNFANPNSDLSDETDFGKITKTVGASRVMQFGAKIRF